MQCGKHVGTPYKPRHVSTSKVYCDVIKGKNKNFKLKYLIKKALQRKGLVLQFKIFFRAIGTLSPPCHDFARAVAARIVLVELHKFMPSDLKSKYPNESYYKNLIIKDNCHDILLHTS